MIVSGKDDENGGRQTSTTTISDVEMRDITTSATPPSTPDNNNNGGYWHTPPLPHLNNTPQQGSSVPPPPPPVVPSIMIIEKNPPATRNNYKRKKSSNNNNNSSSADAFDNIAIAIDSGSGRRGSSRSAASNNNNNEVIAILPTGDEIAWKIISIVLKGWCLIWILFAILVISAELFSPRSSHSNSKAVQTKNVVVAAENEQYYLEISEHVIESCDYTNLKTEEGRMECQSLCFEHMCCFIINDNNDAAAIESSNQYSCTNDPNKMCAAYVGCESLLVSEEDELNHRNGTVDVFGLDTVDAITNDNDIILEEGDTTAVSAVSGENTTPTIQQQSTMSSNNTATSTTTELQLIQQVITSVCHKSNLHTRHGINECASLCNPSMCCFNRTEVEIRNPKMDLILKMEGIGNDVLDRSVMGTCIHEQNDDDEEEETTRQSHFCLVHSGCENILLIGAAPSSLEANRKHYNQALTSEEDAFSVDIYNGNGNSSSNGSITDDQQRMLSVACTFLGVMIGLTAYLLVYKRKPPQLEMMTGGRSDEEEMIDFV